MPFNPAFVCANPLLHPRPTKLSNCAPRRTRAHATRPPRKRTRPVAVHAFEHDDVPDSIQALDMVEYHRRESLGPPENTLHPDARAALLRDFPALVHLDRQLAHAMAADDYHPDDPRVYSWAYRKWRPWALSRFLQVAIPALLVFLTTRLFRLLRSRVKPSRLAAALVAADRYAVIALAVGAALPFLVYAVVSARRKFAPATDAIRRIVLMFVTTTPLLTAAWMMSASANLALGLSAGILTRLYLAAALWLWRDLNREVYLASSRVAPFFRAWRILVTVFVVIGGAALRALTLIAPWQLPLRSEFLLRANRMRLFLGTTFPVSFSLCYDLRGLFFLGSLVSAASVLYGLYLFIFTTDFFRNRFHRRCVTPLTRFLVRNGLYQPNVHPDELLNSLAAPDTVESYLPSTPMMLRREDTISTEGMLADSGVMPILSYLQKEDEILKHEGASTWLKPRTEQVPVTKDMPREKRTLDALYAWSRPLERQEAELSFMDYFETLDDDEYVYDPISGNWVFENPEVLGATGSDKDSETSKDPNAVGKSDRPGLDPKKGEEVLQLRSDGNVIELDASSELRPWLQRFIEEEARKDDDTDDPTVPVYV